MISRTNTRHAGSISRQLIPTGSLLLWPWVCCIVGLMGWIAPFVQADVLLVEEGQPRATIYVSPASDDNESLDQAAQELQSHIKLMTSAILPIQKIQKPEEARPPAIVLGSLAVKMGAQPIRQSTSREGFRLLTSDNRVLIGGESDRAALLGAYELLTRLGFDWVMPGEVGMVIPQGRSIQVPTLDDAEAPAFHIRRLWYRGWKPRVKEDYARMKVWLDRQKAGDTPHPASGAAGHVWDQLIKKNKAVFENDPTMLALVRKPDGQLVRSGPQIESTHPAVIQLFVDQITRTYEKNIAEGIWTAQTPASFPIGPADGLNYSISAESLAAGSGRIDPIVGELDRTDEMVLMANRILKEVHPKYPNAMVGYYSYSTHADYPLKVHPDPHLVQIFAPINFSRFHSALDTSSKTQAYYKGVVEQWSKLSRKQGNPLIYRGYNWNLAENMLPYTKVRIWGEEIPWYHQMGFIAVSVEATKSWSILAASDYVLMRLAWNPEQDWRELLKEFCDKAYGPGSAAMLRYHHRLIDTQHNAGQEAGSYHAFHLMYDDAFIKTSQADIDQARQAATNDRQRARIDMVAHNIKALQIYLDYHAATLRFDFAKARELYDLMLSHWESAHQVNADTVSNEVPQYLKRFIEKFVTQALHYSSDPYRIVYRIPDVLPTLHDPQVVGHMLNYQSPLIHDDTFATTRTYTTTWDAQGLTGLRDGAVWYRIHFKLPADAKGQPIGLFIGGVEDEARVWLNGHLIGTSGRGFSSPFVFDLTEHIQYDQDNLLAIAVVRNSKANEIGLGGIIRPSFLFAGPQLDRPSPKPLELRRVLPGGELGEVE